MGTQMKGFKIKRHDDGQEVVPMSEGEVKKLRQDYSNLVKKVIELEDRIEKSK